MRTAKDKKRETACERVKICALSAGELFAAFSTVYFMINGSVDRFLLALVTVLLVICPLIFERIFNCYLSPILFVLAVIYSVCPLLGHSYNLYYIIPWWDKMLHFTGGVVFAVVGYFLCGKMLHQPVNSKLPYIAFAICFSVTVAAFWEFFEFGADMLVGTDMQSDRFVRVLHSYFLGDSYGVIGSIDEIESVVINGAEMEGYIDIGLIDTMGDMIIETLGAVIASGVYILDRGRHPFIYSAESMATNDKEEVVICPMTAKE